MQQSCLVSQTAVQNTVKGELWMIKFIHSSDTTSLNMLTNKKAQDKKITHKTLNVRIKLKTRSYRWTTELVLQLKTDLEEALNIGMQDVLAITAK